MTRQINSKGLSLIKTYEGFSPTPYIDIAGVATIGYGTTHGITMQHSPITQAEAEQYLRDDLEEFEQAVEDNIGIDLNDNQYSAIVCFVYNEGAAPLKGTLGNLLNSTQFDAAMADMMKYVWVHIDGKPVESKGLLNRRVAEVSLFKTPD